MFEELAYAQTPLGELSLRKRWDLTFKMNVYEIKLNDEFLMSSLFTMAEEELARIALSVLDTKGVDIIIGGLGLGYTARAALKNEDVRSVVVVEFLEDVIQWHEKRLLPVSDVLCSDSRCRFVHGDFFAMAREENGFDPGTPERQFDAILLDIDHAPDFTLHNSHQSFYSPQGLKNLHRFIRSGGVFGLWSNELPDKEFIKTLQSVFDEAQAHIVSFYNPLQDRDSENTVYIARMPVISA